MTKQIYSEEEIGRIVAHQIAAQYGHQDYQDYEDMIQDACEGAIKGKKKDKGQKYQFKAARNQALKGLWYGVWGKKSPPRRDKLSIDSYEEELIEEAQEQKSSFISQKELENLFYENRKKKGNRGKQAAKRDAYIALRLMEGAGNAAIATELEIPEHDVRHYRSEIQKRLKEILDND